MDIAGDPPEMAKEGKNPTFLCHHITYVFPR
jgi:hypothetical protein